MIFQKKHIILFFFSFFLLKATAEAEITLPLVLGSNMVLQCNKPVTIWGKASAGEKITVSFKNQSANASANENGHWELVLKAMPASFDPADMTISGDNKIVLHNVLVGEVWLCSGQSNMEYTMTKSTKYANAIHSKGLDSAALSKEKNTSIRLFLVKRDLNKPGDINKGWNPAEGPSLGAFSAAGYYFAKELFSKLHVPVGVIASSVSGSAIEPWMSGAPTHADDQQGFKVDETKPGKFYEGMIKPLSPFTLNGFLWYQGETNCFLQETVEYTRKFTQLITSWRSLWHDPSLSFYFVEIAPFLYSKSKDKVGINEGTLPAFREAQSAALSLPHTGMIVTTDLVDNLDDIHPTYKWEIGRRLALLALAKTYHKNITASGPTFSKATKKGNKIELDFSNTDAGLISSNGLPPDEFMIAGDDGKFLPAQAAIENNHVMVWSNELTKPAYVRFGWKESAQPNLFNKAGLPAVPFRTDHPKM